MSAVKAPYLPADPSADVRDEVAVASGVPEPIDKIWFHKTAAAVIDAGRCVGCGGCIAACPSRSISIGTDGSPTLTRMCTGCSACWDYCPLAGLRSERLAREGQPNPLDDVGTVIGAYSAGALAAPDGAQDGGAVTTLLAALLEAGHIDGVILTRKKDAFHGEPFLATTPSEVLEAAGSVYHQSHPLEVLNREVPEGVERLAFVGTPCQLTALKALQRFPWRYRRTAAHAVVLTIGLFCSRSFDPMKLMRSMLERGTDVSQIGRIDIRDGQLVAESRDGSSEVLRGPVKEFRQASLRGCDECSDFAAFSADLAVGNVGSGKGASTVLVRTLAGAAAWAAAGTALSVEELTDLEPVRELARRNRVQAERALLRAWDPEGELWISYEEHLETYTGTDREPEPPPPHRSHHYEVSC